MWNTIITKIDTNNPHIVIRLILCIYMVCLPIMVVMAPSDEAKLFHMNIFFFFCQKDLNFIDHKALTGPR